jgi:hypothetical protein
MTTPLIDLEFDLIAAESEGDTKEAARLRAEIDARHQQDEMDALIREVTEK